MNTSCHSIHRLAGSTHRAAQLFTREETYCLARAGEIGPGGRERPAIPGISARRTATMAYGCCPGGAGCCGRGRGGDGPGGPGTGGLNGGVPGYGNRGPDGLIGGYWLPGGPCGQNARNARPVATMDQRCGCQAAPDRNGGPWVSFRWSEFWSAPRRGPGGTGPAAFPGLGRAVGRFEFPALLVPA